MIFHETPLRDAYLLTIDEKKDERGFFARTWDPDEFKTVNISSNIIQCSISFNKKKGTVRGMHYQVAPFMEAKLVRCTQGKLFDVIIDLRKGSPTFLQWYGAELTAENHAMLYIPKGFAHGFQTLEDKTEVFYQIEEKYSPEHARGVRWNDPAFSVVWPLDVTCISERDNAYADIDRTQWNGI